MRRSIAYILPLVAVILLQCSSRSDQKTAEEESVVSAETVQGTLLYDQEVHFKNVRQLTFGGDNAEAYWSFGNDRLVFQSNFKEWNVECDQIFIYDLSMAGDSRYQPSLVSTGMGRTTCAYFLPGDSTFVYASTHEGGENCPPVPERRTDGKYVWPIYESYDIYTANTDGEITKKLTNDPGYDAEATVSPQGDKIVFTSMRTGDLELYVMDLDGSNVVQVTDELGYDGGAFFSPDGTQLVFRASRPKTEEEIADYKALLAEGLVQPTEMEIFVVNVDGTGLRQVTDLGKANWAPYFHPSGEKIIFSSNHAAARGFSFNLYMINADGTDLQKISHDEVFDSFPMFSPDGKQIVFSSNRNNNGTRDTNLFIAEWVD